MNTSNESVISIFRIARMCMGLSLDEMAEKCNVSAIYLSELERGKKTNPSDEFINKFANGCYISSRTIKYFLEHPKSREYYQQHFIREIERMAIRSMVLDNHNIVQ